MTELFKKLNYKNQKEIIVLHAPTSFDNEMLNMSTSCTIQKNISDVKSIDFIINFVLKQQEINFSARMIVEKTEGDAIIWFAFPKKTSKKFICDFDRDNGWEIMGKLGWEGVRMVSINEDWTALRFRKVAYIKSMTRSFAMTETGKLKAKKE